MNEIILNLQICFLPITLGKFVLLLSLSSSFPMPPFDVYPFLSFATLDVVLELCDLPTSLACLHCFLDLSLMLLVFVWCYVFNLNHWSAKRPVFLFSSASYNFIFKPLICKEICFAFSIFYNTIQSFVI